MTNSSGIREKLKAAASMFSDRFLDKPNDLDRSIILRAMLEGFAMGVDYYAKKSPEARL